jgi:hypothetical protein
MMGAEEVGEARALRVGIDVLPTVQGGKRGTRFAFGSGFIYSADFCKSENHRVIWWCIERSAHACSEPFLPSLLPFSPPEEHETSNASPCLHRAESR